MTHNYYYRADTMKHNYYYRVDNPNQGDVHNHTVCFECEDELEFMAVMEEETERE